MARNKILYRSAVSGKFIKLGYAKQHPKTTVKEKVKINRPDRKRK